MANYDYYVVQGKTLDNIAETMKTALGVNKDTPIRFDEITSSEKTEQITENINTQTEVIEQIKVALNEKSSVGVKEIVDIIDQSGVLDSTDGTVTEKVEQLIDKAEWEEVWYKQTERLSNATTLFAYLEAKTLPRSNLIYTRNCADMCKDSTIEYIDYYLNTEIANTFISCFENTKQLKRIVGINLSKALSVQRLFMNSAIAEIDEPLDFSLVQNANSQAACFQNANLLVKIRFVAESIKWSIAFPSAVLSDESIQSIIDGLATVEMAQTLTLHADVKAKLTEEQLATITGKNWNLA